MGYLSLVDVFFLFDDFENLNDSVDGDMFFLEFVDSSVDINEGLYVLDEDEFLWLIFFEFL